MTEARYASFPLDSITVDRASRQRKELSNIEGMMQSLQLRGQLQPIVIERNGNLRAGERRYTAAKALGWTHIDVRFLDELDEAELQAVELEENFRRENLTWQEECQAVAKYHALRSAERDWTINKTADALGWSNSAVVQRLQIMEEVQRGNTAVLETDRFSTARGLTQRAAERRVASTVAALGEGIEVPSPQLPHSLSPILNADFCEWSKTYNGRSFNFLHCDFPYGVNADKHNQGAAESFGGYADTLDVYERLLDALGAFMAHGVSQSAHLMFWFSMDYYALTYDRLTAMGWTVNRFPLIWYKSDNTGILPDPTRGPRRIYETAFLCSRGDRKVVRAVSNVVAAPVVKTIHMSEKNYDMLKKFMEMLVDDTTVLLDPTCGSGNAIRAAKSLGAASCLGLEINPEFAKLAGEAYNEQFE